MANLKSYQSFSSDYGIVVGRVMSQNVGIPNVKISIFVPKKDATTLDNKVKGLTSLDQTKIKLSELLYNYETPDDTDSKGKRYNLFSRFTRFRKESGFPNNIFGIGFKPKTPIGSLSEKEEILLDEQLLYIHENYYQFTTVTNSSGDFMLMSPTGAQQIHMDCDITDIGPYSVSPLFLYQTTSAQKDAFEGDIEGSKIKYSDSLESLPNIITQNTTINVKPLFSNEDNQQVGITFQNFKIVQNIQPTAVIFGNNVGMSKDSYYGDYAFARMYFGFRNLCIGGGTKCKDVPCEGGVQLVFDGISLSPFSVDFCIRVVLPKIFPFFKIETSIFENGGFFRCRIGGGPLQKGSFNFNYVDLKPPCTCDEITEDIILNGQDENDLTDSLDLNDLENNPTKIKLLSIGNTVSDNDADLMNSGDIVALDNLDINSDIKLLPVNQYAQVNLPGTFLLEVPMNRRRKITNRYGELVDSDGEIGIFTEARYSMLIEQDAETIGSQDGKRKVDRAKIKVPTLSTNNYGIDYNTNQKWWIAKHFKFEFNNIYTVSQYINTINNYATLSDHTRADSNTVINGIAQFGSPVLTIKRNFSWDFDTLRILELPNGDMLPNVDNFKLTSRITDNSFQNEWLNGTLYFPNFMYKIKKNRNKDTVCSTIVKEIRNNSNPLGANQINSKFYLSELFPTNFIEVEKNDFVNIFKLLDKKGVNDDDVNPLLGNYPFILKKYFYKGLRSNSFTLMKDSNVV